MVIRQARSLLLVPCIALLLAGAAETSADAKADTVPPNLILPERGAFVVGSTISATSFDAENGWPLDTTMQMRAQWSATDPSGICGYRTREVFDDYKSGWTAWGNQRSLTRTVSDYDDQEGGGSDKYWGVEVSARDCGGRNTTTKFVRLAPVVYQQDGLSYRYGTMNVTTTGAWSTSTCACWSAGTTKWTSSKGARINFALSFEDIAPGSTVAVGLVMERAPDRGKFRLLLDGTQIATVDTYAPTKLHRSVVWTGSIAGGTHTLSLINLATPGRPRIDVDALSSASIQTGPIPE